MIKKRGSSLIMVVAITAIMSILSVSILTQAVMANKLGKVNERIDKVSLIAESGLEKGLTLIKQKIYETPNIFVSNISLAPQNFTFTEGDIVCTVEFEDKFNYMDGGINKGQAVIINSSARSGTSGIKKQMKAHILKSDISNIYFDMVFGNVFTALDEVHGNNGVTFDMALQKNNLVLSGSTYLQGGTVNLKPASVSMASGEIKINSNRFDTITNNIAFLKSMSITTLTPITNSVIKNNVKNLTPTKLDILSINSASSADSELSDFYAGGTYTNPNPNYTVRSVKQVSKDASGRDKTTLVTFKITKKYSATQSSEFEWSIFVDDVKDYIMRNMLGYTGPKTNNYGNTFEDKYKGMYKMYIVEGDVIINQKDTSGYINHVIYSTGKVTIDSEYVPGLFRPNTFSFKNSSIMAKKIIIKDMTRNVFLVGNIPGDIELYGIKKIDEQVNNGELSPFSADNRANINKFLIQHLNGYADALRFKVHKWEEQ